MAKLLIVDDEVAVADVLRECLEAEGHDVYLEFDGLNALKTMLDVRPDLVVSDVMMPHMGAAALLTAMQDNAYLAQTPVIVMSSWPEQYVSGLCSGYVAFLKKPFLLDELHVLVENVLSATPAGARKPAKH